MGLDSGRKLEESEHLGGFSVGGCVRASLTIFSIEIEPTEEMGGGRRGRGRERKKKEGRKEGEEGRPPVTDSRSSSATNSGALATQHP